jgi:hypothetical protein
VARNRIASNDISELLAEIFALESEVHLAFNQNRLNVSAP